MREKERESNILSIEFRLSYLNTTILKNVYIILTAQFKNLFNQIDI